MVRPILKYRGSPWLQQFADDIPCEKGSVKIRRIIYNTLLGLLSVTFPCHLQREPSKETTISTYCYGIVPANQLEFMPGTRNFFRQSVCRGFPWNFFGRVLGNQLTYVPDIRKIIRPYVSTGISCKRIG